MKKITPLVIMLLFFLSSHAQQPKYLGLNEKDLTNLLSKDETIYFSKKGRANDGSVYLSYIEKEDNIGSRSYYFDKNGICQFIRCVYENRYLSFMIKQVNSSKMYKSTNTAYEWISKDETHLTAMEIVEDSKVFSVIFKSL